MKITVIGGGLSGCSIARLLKDRGHAVKIMEKRNTLGGLCATGTKDGRIYQLFGPHYFHSNSREVIDFVTKYSRFNGHIHRKGICIDGKIIPYPISLETIQGLQEKDQILRELASLPNDPDRANFESFMTSVVGKTLYEKFIRNYTSKFWGVPPDQLEAGWATTIEVRADNRGGYFKDEWQGLPVDGYTRMFERLTEGIEVVCSAQVKNFRELACDLIVSTIPVDELLHFQYGRLDYRGMRFEVNFNQAQWENEQFDCINYPDRAIPYVRKTNYRLCYGGQGSSSSIVGYEFPDEADRMYPLHNAKNRDILRMYLKHLAGTDNLMTAGRLGLFRYYDMDEAIHWCLENIDAIEQYAVLSIERKMTLFTGDGKEG